MKPWQVKGKAVTFSKKSVDGHPSPMAAGYFVMGYRVPTNYVRTVSRMDIHFSNLPCFVCEGDMRSCRNFSQGGTSRAASKSDLCPFHPLIRAETNRFCAASAVDDEILIQGRQELGLPPVRQQVSEPLYGQHTNSSSSYHKVRLHNVSSKSGPSPKKLLKTYWATNFKFSSRSERGNPKYDNVMPSGITRSSTKWTEVDAALAYDCLARRYRGSPVCHGTSVVAMVMDPVLKLLRVLVDPRGGLW